MNNIWFYLSFFKTLYLGIIIAHTGEKGNLYQIIPNSTAFFNQLLYQLLYIYTQYISFVSLTVQPTISSVFAHNLWAVKECLVTFIYLQLLTRCWLHSKDPPSYLDNWNNTTLWSCCFSPQVTEFTMGMKAFYLLIINTISKYFIEVN